MTNLAQLLTAAGELLASIDQYCAALDEAGDRLTVDQREAAMALVDVTRAGAQQALVVVQDASTSATRGVEAAAGMRDMPPDYVADLAAQLDNGAIAARWCVHMLRAARRLESRLSPADPA